MTNQNHDFITNRNISGKSAINRLFFHMRTENVHVYPIQYTLRYMNMIDRHMTRIRTQTFSTKYRKKKSQHAYRMIFQS